MTDFLQFNISSTFLYYIGKHISIWLSKKIEVVVVILLVSDRISRVYSGRSFDINDYFLLVKISREKSKKKYTNLFFESKFSFFKCNCMRKPDTLFVFLFLCIV